MTFPYRSPLEAELHIPEKLAYLDLGSGTQDKITIGLELMTKNIPHAAGHLDLALSRSTILVPYGQVKVFSKILLLHQGSNGKFVLFSNLPNEIKSYIFKLCSDEEPRRISFIEMDEDGFRSMQVIGARRPAIFAASKLALLDAIVTKKYVAMFATFDNNTKLYFRSGHDWAQLGFFQLPSAPKTQLAAALVNKLDLSYIHTLQMDHQGLFFDHEWSADNLAQFSNIKLLFITAHFSDPGRAELGFYTLYFQEVLGDRISFMPYCVGPDGVQAEYGGAFDAMDRYICYIPEKIRIRHISMTLDSFLRTMPNFPSLIKFFFEYSPVPGNPLAAVQPLVQPW